MRPKKDVQLDLSEKGKGSDGQPISLDRRLFMQFLAYGHCPDSGSLVEALQQADISGVLYEDINDPQGVGLLTLAESPDYFLSDVRQLLNQPPFAALSAKPEYTMLGRTYAIGYESNLTDTLLEKPRQKVLNPEWPWVVWYLVARAKSFETLSAKEQSGILMEHGGIGFNFGRAGYARDIRLACHGLDKNDNDFVIGLLGQELFPLSAVVQAMRKTKQTSQYLDNLGPFFIGKAIWQSEG